MEAVRSEGEEGTVGRIRAGTDPISEITLVSSGASPGALMVLKALERPSEPYDHLLSWINFPKAALCFHFTSIADAETWTNQERRSRNSHHLSPLPALRLCSNALNRESGTALVLV